MSTRRLHEPADSHCECDGCLAEMGRIISEEFGWPEEEAELPTYEEVLMATYREGFQ